MYSGDPRVPTPEFHKASYVTGHQRNDSRAGEEGGADVLNRMRRAGQRRLEEGAVAGLGHRIAVGSLGQPVGGGEDEDVVSL